LIAISNVFGMLGFYVPFVYLPNMAVLQGIPVESANFLLSIIGISNTIGKQSFDFVIGKQQTEKSSITKPQICVYSKFSSMNSH
jgi:hypothetical protein